MTQLYCSKFLLSLPVDIRSGERKKDSSQMQFQAAQPDPWGPPSGSCNSRILWKKIIENPLILAWDLNPHDLGLRCKSFGD